MPVRQPTILPNDWYTGTVPTNVAIDPTAYFETSHSFLRYRSERPLGLRIGEGAGLYDPVLDIGPHGSLEIGARVLVSSACFLVDAEVTVGELTMIAWGALVMDCRRGREPARPVHIGRNVWIGFEACILPGSVIGEGSVIGARAVVSGEVPPFSVVVGNPGRIIRTL